MKDEEKVPIITANPTISIIQSLGSLCSLLFIF
jgi:hypothetical protein